MTHGGKRRGAGRPPDIPAADAALIRKDCEQRSLAARKKQWEDSIERKMAKRGWVWGEDGEPNPIELDDEFLDYRPTVSRLGSLEPDKRIPTNLPIEVRYAIETIRANKIARGKREYYSVEKLPRLYGSRQKIIDAVASSWEFPREPCAEFGNPDFLHLNVGAIANARNLISGNHASSTIAMFTANKRRSASR